MEAGTRRRLELLPLAEYAGVNQNDPIRFYRYPVLGKMYVRRVELCLAECRGGQRVLEIGFGSGVSFLSLAEIYREIWGLDLTANVEQVTSVFAQRGIRTNLSNGNVLSMPFQDNFFDTVLLISILEHLRPQELPIAISEISRVLKPGGQAVYGVPVERALMRAMFRCIGCNIGEHHFSTHDDVAKAASAYFQRVRIIELKPMSILLGSIYQVGHFVKLI